MRGCTELEEPVEQQWDWMWCQYFGLHYKKNDSDLSHIFTFSFSVCVEIFIRRLTSRQSAASLLPSIHFNLIKERKWHKLKWTAVHHCINPSNTFTPHTVIFRHLQKHYFSIPDSILTSQLLITQLLFQPSFVFPFKEWWACDCSVLVICDLPHHYKTRV